MTRLTDVGVPVGVGGRAVYLGQSIVTVTVTVTVIIGDG